MSASEQLSASNPIEAMAQRARVAALESARLDGGARRAALELMAAALEANKAQIAEANALDLSAAEENGVSGALLNRLRLDEAGVVKVAAAVREIAAQDDPLGAVDDEVVRPNGLRVGRMRIPLGVVAMIYESRPNVTADAAALCLKAGNAVILRGGSEAFYSNRAIADAIRAGLAESKVPMDAVQLVGTTDRAAINTLLEQEE